MPMALSARLAHEPESKLSPIRQLQTLCFLRIVSLAGDLGVEPNSRVSETRVQTDIPIPNTAARF